MVFPHKYLQSLSIMQFRYITFNAKNQLVNKSLTGFQSFNPSYQAKSVP